MVTRPRFRQRCSDATQGSYLWSDLTGGMGRPKLLGGCDVKKTYKIPDEMAKAMSKVAGAEDKTEADVVRDILRGSAPWAVIRLLPDRVRYKGMKIPKGIELFELNAGP